MPIQRQALTQVKSERSIKENEVWVVVVRGNQYELTGNQAEVLRRVITSGSRGIVWFKDFAISIPYVEEVYKKYEKGDPNDPLVKASL